VGRLPFGRLAPRQGRRLAHGTAECVQHFLAVDALPSGGWVLAGSDGWSQNPDGLSVLSNGTKLLATLPTIGGPLTRLPLLAGPRHNELRTVLADAGLLWLGGHEDGPVMHTGDLDRSLITATGVLGFVRPAP
jgi:hypothetical protein